jgi:hypothetical protein
MITFYLILIGFSPGLSLKRSNRYAAREDQNRPIDQADPVLWETRVVFMNDPG